MAMISRPIRLPAETYALIREHAASRGMAYSEFMREAGLARVFYERARAGDKEMAAAIQVARERLRR